MTIYAGYSGTLWKTVYSAMAVLNAQLTAAATVSSGQPSPSVTTLVETSNTMLQTVLNGAEAVNANATVRAWQNELNSLQSILALPLVLTPDTATILSNRTNAYAAGMAALQTRVPQAPYGDPGLVTSGMAPVPSAGLLDFYNQFTYETPPAGLTSGNLITNALAVSGAFAEVASAILTFQGINVTQLYDVAQREALVAGVTAQILQDATAGGFAADVVGMNTWNQIVTVPALTMCADILNGSPDKEELQQEAVLRNVMLTTASQLAAYLLSQRVPNAAQVRLTTLLTGESLMDVAARTLGDFEQWTAIATLNGLMPPYVGINSSPGIAGWGSQLLIPVPGANNSAIGTVPSYTANYLGIDLYFGPINGEMPAWTGDFQIIRGYKNLAWALGRRLQTTQGTLIFHTNYGSRIPPEVGAVQSLETAGHIASFGKSALLSDPRVDKVISAVASLLPGSQIQFKAEVQPGGFQTTPVEVNEVIAALPG